MAGYVQSLKKYSKAKKWLAKDAWAKHADPGDTFDQLASMCCELSIRPNGEDWTLRCEDVPESHRATMDEYCDLWFKKTELMLQYKDIKREDLPVHAPPMLESYNPDLCDDDSSNHGVESALLHITPLSGARYAVVTARKAQADLRTLLLEYGRTPARTEGSQQVSVKQSDQSNQLDA